MINLYNPFWKKLKTIDICEKDFQQLISHTRTKLINPVQGDYPRWYQSYQELPEIEQIKKNTHIDAITCSSLSDLANPQIINQAYKGLMPWRKGPFNMFSIFIDSEWQSNMKWKRIEKKLPDLKNKVVLDVGCGNGYYIFRMMDKHPFLVMGIDPGLLQVMQFWSIEKYVQSGACVLPIAIQDMPKTIDYFDVVFSMGVLYHRKSPIHHIKELASFIKPKGHLVIETLIVKGDESTCLLPGNRYAQMRNVWFLPSVAMLKIMLQRCGFSNIECIDITTTSVDEQRTTKWMKFHSLKEFLNDNKSKTIEGYELPTRATIVAEKI